MKIFDPDLSREQVLQRATAVLGQDVIDEAKRNRQKAMVYIMRHPDRIQETINNLIRLQKQSFHEASRYARSLHPDLLRAIASMWISEPPKNPLDPEGFRNQ